MALTSGSDFGPYKVIEPIGQGGMASVYKAFHAALSRFVALKILPEKLAKDPDFKERFHEEAVRVANLRHNNIMAVYDYGEIDKTTYIATEFIDGGTFDQQMGQPLPVSYVIDILGPIASALDYAHSRGVLHRDVKPSNILVAKDGRPMLGDFGLARMMVADQNLTQAGMILGTPSYMAPEQGAGLPEPASDIYALGIIAYQALTGRVPYQAATPMAVVLAHQSEPLPMPRSINPAIPPEVEEVLLKCLARNPADRYATGEKFIRALGQARQEPLPTPTGPAPAIGGPLAAVGVPAAPPPPPPPSDATQGMAAPPVKKGNRGLLFGGLGAGCLLLLLLACGGGVWYLGSRPVANRSPQPSAGGVTAAPSAAPSTGGGAGEKGMFQDAAETVAGRGGFENCDTDYYQQEATLHVLICTNADDKDKVFFFVNDFIATDTNDPSVSITVINQDDKSITIEYGMFHPADDDCCPSAGPVTVTYHWDGSKVTTPDKIPTSDPKADPSRR
jgi:tRNA A-37 threonylcarbamoyl transferase component Bud32